MRAGYPARTGRPSAPARPRAVLVSLVMRTAAPIAAGRALGALALGTYLLVGAVWLLRHFGEVPHYGDTFTYLEFARRMEVNAHRGFLYPMLLSLTGRNCLEESRPRNLPLRAEEAQDDLTTCSYPGCWMSVQVGQTAAFFAAIWYFLSVLARPCSKVTVTILSLIVALDPLVAHYNLALMTDALATTGALVFCAALYGLVTAKAEEKVRTVVHALLLVIGTFLACGVRVEKWLIFVATTAATVATWALAKRFGGRRLAVAALLVLTAVALSRGLQRKYQTVSDDWWTVGESAVHFRLIYPNLRRIYDQLPDGVRARLSREDAAEYDQTINNIRGVVNRITKGDAEIRHRLTEQMARTAVRQLWPSLMADIGHDFVTNLLATYTFWAQLAVRELWRNEAVRELPGAVVVRRWLPSSTAYWNFTRLTMHHRRWIQVHMYLSWFLIGTATLLSVVTALRWVRRRPRTVSWSALLPWTPALWLWFFNAAAFAASVNISNVRYMIFSHVMILVLILAAGGVAYHGGRFGCES